MKIALVGYGKMGKTIEQIALSRGHEIVLKISDQNIQDFNSNNFKNVDVAIEFTNPESAFNNLNQLMTWKVPTVCGTTGWINRKQEIEELCIKHSGSFLYASNFSLGVNLFFELNLYLAKLMSNFEQYDVKMTEIHHLQKLDAPSGTAITLAEQVLEGFLSKKSWTCIDSNSFSQIASETLEIKAIRQADVPGTHTILYDSDVDQIEITHQAKNRNGFAFGAVVAAEFIAHKTGLFTMKEVLGV